MLCCYGEDECPGVWIRNAGQILNYLTIKTENNDCRPDGQGIKPERIVFMQKNGEKIVYQGDWLRMKKISCEKEGKQYDFEAVERTNEYGAVVIVARLLPSRRMVLLKQYRLLIENYIIAFPAGLAESSDIETEALRELMEETGYHGRVTRISPPLKSNPALINDQIYIVNVEIDETAPENQHPVQHLEASEEIEVLLAEEQHIASFLTEKRQEGFEIGIGPWYAFALCL